MTRSEYKKTIALKAKTKRMINIALEDVKKDIDKLFNSGGFDINDFENDYCLPRIIASIVLEKAAKEVEPLSKDLLKVKKNLSYYI